MSGTAVGLVAVVTVVAVAFCICCRPQVSGLFVVGICLWDRSRRRDLLGLTKKPNTSHSGPVMASDDSIESTELNIAVDHEDRWNPPVSGLPLDIRISLNDAHLLHLLATDPNRVLPNNKSLVSVFSEATHLETRPSNPIEAQVAVMVKRAFWSEVRSSQAICQSLSI